MNKPEKFDPSNPFDAMAETFRRQIVGIATGAYRTTIYREMTPAQKLESFMGGVLTGLVGVCFASIQPEGRDEMMKAITAYLPQAREQVEGIFIDSGAEQIGHQ